MTSQPEKLFRDKLLDYKRTAPDAAWKRIEQNLDKPRAKYLFMKVAAAILILAIPGYLLLEKDKVENEVAVGEKIELSVPPSINNNDKKENDRIIVPPLVAVNVTPTRKQETRTVNSHKDQLNTIKKEVTRIIPETEAAIHHPVSEENVSIALPVSQEASPTIETPKNTPGRTSTVIVYTTEEVNAKFLRKKKPIEEPAAKRFDGVRKVSDLVYNIKNSEKGLGDLRQWKDEILSFDFIANNDQSPKNKN